MYFLGIDIGSLSCDAVLIDAGGQVAASAVVPTGAKTRESIATRTVSLLKRTIPDYNGQAVAMSGGVARNRKGCSGHRRDPGPSGLRSPDARHGGRPRRGADCPGTLPEGVEGQRRKGRKHHQG